MKKDFHIGRRSVGPNDPVFIIAEAGVNHNGDIALAKQLVDRALESGADAVKFQSFNANRLVSPTAPKAEYQLKETDPNESQFDMIRALELSEEAHHELKEYCEEKGILFLSTPFDAESCQFLVDLGVSALKIGSGEVTNWPLLEVAAKSKLPVILSTGMSTLEEVDAAVRHLEKHGVRELSLLHCISSYPAPEDEINLKALTTLQQNFDHAIGYSDHSEGAEACIAATSLGATILEKHFTIDRTLPGPDHKASLEPSELKSLVESVRRAEQMMGDGVKKVMPCEENTKMVARKSLATSKKIPKGTIISEEHLIPLRPNTGISPTKIDDVLGKRTKVDIPEATLIEWSHLE